MSEESKNKVLMIFLVIIFVFLGLIIFVFLYNSYQTSSNYTVTETRSSLQCSEYSFRIEGGSLNYADGTLSFIFDPSLGKSRVKNPLILIIDNEEIETSYIDFTFKQKLRIKTQPLTTFQIYPKGCKDILRTCNLDENKCE